MKARSEVKAKTKSPRLGYLLHDLFLDCHFHSVHSALSQVLQRQHHVLSRRDCHQHPCDPRDRLPGIEKTVEEEHKSPLFPKLAGGCSLPEEMRLSSLPLIRPPAEEAPSLGTGKPVTDRHHQLSGCHGLLKCVVQAHLCLERVCFAERKWLQSDIALFAFPVKKRGDFPLIFYLFLGIRQIFLILLASRCLQVFPMVLLWKGQIP